MFVVHKNEEKMKRFSMNNLMIDLAPMTMPVIIGFRYYRVHKI